MKILFFGDIVGKIGRTAIRQVIADLKKEVEPDLIMANVENLAHGTGVTEKTLQELLDLGFGFFTSGNHIFDKPEAEVLLSRKDFPLIRPANYPLQTPGDGYKIISVGSRSLLIVNLIGRVFIKENFDCPFRKIDEILAAVDTKKLAGIIVDFHAEATSEKIAMGHYLAGRVSAVLGTHTPVATADARILPPGTAYLTDIGMVGAMDSVIGVDKGPVLKMFLSQMPASFQIPEEGEVIINAVVLTIDPQNQKVLDLTRLDRVVKV